MRRLIRSLLRLALAGSLLLAGCAAGSTPAASPSAASDPTPSAATAPDPTPTPTPTATPVPTTDGQGDEYVVGSWTVGLMTPYTETPRGDVKELRGGAVSITSTMNDPRVSGGATFAFSVDAYTKVRQERGTFQLTNADGAGDGTCTGGSWDSGNSAIWSCWLTGSGAYKGYTAYLQIIGHGAFSEDVRGIIYPGSPPKP
jgi:hypothetical protein